MPFHFIENLSHSRRASITMYAEAIFGLELFIAPVMVLVYMRYVGLSFAEMSAFFSLILVLNWILELPTGVISDAVGRKKSLIVSKLIYLVGMLMLLVIKDWGGLICIAILLSVGNTLGSGNLSAICFEAFNKDNCQKDFHRYSANSTTVALIVSAVAAIASGYLADIDLRLVIYADALMLVLSTVAVWLVLPDHKSIHDLTLSDFQALKGDALLMKLASIIKNGAKVIVGTPGLIFAISVSALSFAALRSGLNLYQPLMEQNSVDISHFGWWFAGFNIIAAVSAYCAGQLPEHLKEKGLLLQTSLLIMLGSALLIVLGEGAFVIFVAISAHQVVRGILPPHLMFETNRFIPRDHPSRTSILSFSALIRALLTAIVMTSIGVLEQETSTVLAFAILGVGFVAGCILAYIMIKVVIAPLCLGSRSSTS